MEILTDVEYEVLLDETTTVEEITCDVGGFDFVSRYVNKWSEESFKEAMLPHGLKLELHEQKFDRNYGVKVEHYDYPLTSQYYLSGDHGVISPGIENVESEYIEKSGHSYLFYLPDIKEIEQSLAGDRVQRLLINIELDFLRSFVKSLDQIPQQLKLLIESDKPPRFHRPVGKVTPMMRTIIEQIWHHPYNGAIARMYLEAKVIELFALQLSQLIEQEQARPTSLKLLPKEIDRIHQARKILQQNYLNPPSVIDLARQVGLDHMKFKRGFRHIFGTTPFNDLQNYRLDLARVLLEDERITVTTVANRIGYSNVSYFSRVFKRRFGITPGKCGSRCGILLD
jgi:AraC family transcriptional regulator, transcriptional activator of the genes for pyochelin and ferripyochelin receptors